MPINTEPAQPETNKNNQKMHEGRENLDEQAACAEGHDSKDEQRVEGPGVDSQGNARMKGKHRFHEEQTKLDEWQ